MKKYLLLLLLPVQLFSQDLQLEKFVDSLMGFAKPNLPGTMILIAQDGKPLVQKAYGLASIELNVPLRTDHAFAIGSVSKQFIATAILKLAEAGKLKLSDDISKYLPGVNTWGHVITVENLLNHTSGISSSERKGFTAFGTANGARVHTDEFISFIMSEKLLFPPGTNWSYNNVAYRISSRIIEKVTGMPFRDYVKEHVFRPAGMMHTYIGSDLETNINLPTSYSRGYGGKWRNENRRPLWDWSAAAGGVITTMDDMLKWDIALRENKVLPAEWRQKAWAPTTLKNGEKVDYGYGWHVSKYNDLNIIYHTGSTYAYNSISIHIPEKKLYLFYGICYPGDPGVPKRILSRMLNIPFPKANDTDAKMSDYEGTFHVPHPGSRMDIQISDRPIYATFTTSGDSLFMRYTEREKTWLRPAGKDQFLPRSGDQLFTFHRNEKGDVTSFTIKPFLYGGTVSEKNKKVNIAPVPELKVISVKPETLNKYAGTYYKTFGDDYFFVTVQNNKLYGYEMDIAQKFELLPVAQNRFVRNGVNDISYTFKSNGKVLTISGNRTSDYRKVADY